MSSVQGGSDTNHGLRNNVVVRKFKKAGRIGGIAYGTYSRMKAGDSASVALGKTILSKAALSLIPCAAITVNTVKAIRTVPKIFNKLDATIGAIDSKKSIWGFKQSESQVAMMQVDLSNMQNARNHLVKSMANHAAGAQKYIEKLVKNCAKIIINYVEK